MKLDEDACHDILIGLTAAKVKLVLDDSSCFWKNYLYYFGVFSGKQQILVMNKKLTKQNEIDIKNTKILYFLIRVPFFKFILFFLLITLWFGVITYFLPINLTSETSGKGLESIIEQLIFGVLIVPLIETLLFQSLIITIICKIVKRSRLNIIPALAISAIAFGLNHSYNLAYFIYTLIIGFFLALAYFVARFRKESATLSVFLIHAIFNLISFSIDFF
ncbi:MAG: CPBP family intramembrane glutamic endopeptidase [Bacteroidota bacterium]